MALVGPWSFWVSHQRCSILCPSTVWWSSCIRRGWSNCLCWCRWFGRLWWVGRYQVWIWGRKCCPWQYRWSSGDWIWFLRYHLCTCVWWQFRWRRLQGWWRRVLRRWRTCLFWLKTWSRSKWRKKLNFNRVGRRFWGWFRFNRFRRQGFCWYHTWGRFFWVDPRWVWRNSLEVQVLWESTTTDPTHQVLCSW